MWCRHRKRNAPNAEAKDVYKRQSKGTVILEGVRTLKKAVRPTEQNPEGGIQEINGPIHISNVKKVG